MIGLIKTTKLISSRVMKLEGKSLSQMWLGTTFADVNISEVSVDFPFFILKQFIMST